MAPQQTKPTAGEALAESMRQVEHLVQVVRSTLRKFPAESLDEEMRLWPLASPSLGVAVSPGGPHGKLVLRSQPGSQSWQVVLPLEWLGMPTQMVSSRVRALYWQRRTTALSQQAARVSGSLRRAQEDLRRVSAAIDRAERERAGLIEAAGRSASKREAVIARKAARKARNDRKKES